MIRDKILNDEQEEVLTLQLKEYLRLKKMNINKKQCFSVGEDNKLILKEGTLIHGTSPSIETLNSISKLGILNSEYFNMKEDGETYYCADFFRVPEDMPMEEYFKFCKKSEITDEGVRRAKMEASKLPARSQDEIAFIINADNPELKELLSNDPYRDNGKKSEIMKEIVNFSGIQEYYKDKQRISAVLWGIPENYISGIWVGDDVLKNKEMVEQIKKLFPECYITTKEGDIIYKGLSQEKKILDSALEATNDIRTGKMNEEVQKIKGMYKEKSLAQNIGKDAVNQDK